MQWGKSPPFPAKLPEKRGKNKCQNDSLLSLGEGAYIFLRPVIIFLLKTIYISWQIRIVLAIQFSLVPWGLLVANLFPNPLSPWDADDLVCPSVDAAVGSVLAIHLMACGCRDFRSLKLFFRESLWVVGFCGFSLHC